MEWHLLIDCCGCVGCLLADGQSIYDPRIPSDRLMSGVQGAVSELETSAIRRRMMEGKRRKAAQGRLFCPVPAGYVRIGKDRIEKDPDERVRSALELVFSKFGELQSLRQVMIRFHERGGVGLPAAVRDGKGVGMRWSPVTCARIRSVLANPIYAGAYAFGRSIVRTTLSEGRKKAVQRQKVRPEDWEVLIKDSHEGHISWERCERNRRVIADNAFRKSADESRGAVRGGGALLSGLLRCGRCGRRMRVACCGRWNSVHYSCFGRSQAESGGVCCRFGGRRADEAVGAALLRALEPVAMEATLRALEEDAEAESDAVRQAELALERVRCEADRTFRQYDAVDPGNRQVAAELERRWNDRLDAVSGAEAALSRSRDAGRGFRMREAERAACLDLGRGIQRAWRHERVTPGLRKRILRAALVEATADVGERRVRLVMHWQGGGHSEIVVERRASGRNSFAADAETEDVITAPARQMPDGSIAAMLNRCGRRTGKGNRWRKAGVAGFRSCRNIPPYRGGGERERGGTDVRGAIRILGISERTAINWIANGKLPARQVCKGAPWVIRISDLTPRQGLPQPSLFDAAPVEDPSPQGCGAE